MRPLLTIKTVFTFLENAIVSVHAYYIRDDPISHRHALDLPVVQTHLSRLIALTARDIVPSISDQDIEHLIVIVKGFLVFATERNLVRHERGVTACFNRYPKSVLYTDLNDGKLARLFLLGFALELRGRYTDILRFKLDPDEFRRWFREITNTIRPQQ